MHILNTHEVIRIRTIVCQSVSENGCPSLYKFHWQKGCIRIFSHFGLHDDHSITEMMPMLPVAHARSSYTDSKITSLVPQATSSFPLFAVRILPATESWVPGLEQGSTQCDSQSCLLMIIIFFAVGHAFHMQLLCAPSCAQSAITISQSVSVAAKQCVF